MRLAEMECDHQREAEGRCDAEGEAGCDRLAGGRLDRGGQGDEQTGEHAADGAEAQ
jgi:hypothetical protein